jgi:hypothetical protein
MSDVLWALGLICLGAALIVYLVWVIGDKRK